MPNSSNRSTSNFSSRSPELTILIPVFNEEKTISKILKATTNLPISHYEVIIVNDASTDDSENLIRDFTATFNKKNIIVKTFKHPVNQGKGAGIKTGLKHATGEYFVIQDADLEYNPKELPKLLKTAQKNDYDVVYGSRFLGTINNMPTLNYYANLGYNIILRLLYKTTITDMHTCYKMVRTALIKDLKMSSNGFDYATELVSKLLKRGTEIHEIPIRFNGRSKKEGKKIDVMDGIECAYKLLRFRFADSDVIFRERSTTFGRFMIVGGVGFATNYLILFVATHFFNMHHVIAEIIAAIVALQVTFILHDRWTYEFHTPQGTAKLKFRMRYFSYLISNSFGSLITVVAFSYLYDYLTRLTALLVAAVLGVIWNYAINTYIIWQRKERS